jgi:hypothetical protein
VAVGISTSKTGREAQADQCHHAGCSDRTRTHLTASVSRKVCCLLLSLPPMSLGKAAISPCGEKGGGVRLEATTLVIGGRLRSELRTSIRILVISTNCRATRAAWQEKDEQY